MFNASQSGVHNRPSAAINYFVVRTLQKIVSSTESISRFLEPVVDSPGYIALVAELVKSKRKKLVTRQTQTEDR